MIPTEEQTNSNEGADTEPGNGLKNDEQLEKTTQVQSTMFLPWVSTAVKFYNSDKYVKAWQGVDPHKLYADRSPLDLLNLVNI